MGTPAVIADYAPPGELRGVRVNFDGCPDVIGPVLTALISRLGVAGTMEALLSGLEWSGLDAEQRVTGSKRFREVEGVGEAYLPEDGPCGVLLGEVEVFSESWAYVFSADGATLSIFKGRELVEEVSTRHLGSADWADIFRRGQS